jgi:hypothetical protein
MRSENSVCGFINRGDLGRNVENVVIEIIKAGNRIIDTSLAVNAKK